MEAAFAPPKTRGNPDQALAAAAVRHEAEYFVPNEHHNPMELYASTVVFEAGGKLTVYDKTQGVQNVQKYLCGVFGMKPEDVRVMSPFMGGGFGSGLRPQFQVVLAVLAARALQRSVRVVLTRAQMYALGYRPAMIQRIALGANTDGTLDAITHDAVTVTSQYEEFHRQETGWSGLLYKSPNAKYAHRLARLDLPTSCDMRAPSAATALFALESAMDELAVALKLDPLELRLRCYSDRDQNEDKPFRSKALRECYRQGAEAFGWSKRNPAAALDARRQRSGRLGHGDRRLGSAAGADHGAHRAHRQRPCRGGVRDLRHRHRHLHHHGAGRGRHARACRSTTSASSSATRRLPQSPVEGGSWIATSVANGIVTTADAIRDELLRLAKQMPNSPLANASPDDVALADGKLVSKRDASRAVSIADAMRHGKVDRIEQEKTTDPGHDQTHAQQHARRRISSR